MTSSFMKWSLLGLILTAASAVVASIVPSKTDDPELVNGTLTWSTLAGDGSPTLTCELAFLPVSICHYTMASVTTNFPQLESMGDEGPFTVDNTTLWENLYW